MKDDDITANYHRGNPRSVEAHESIKHNKSRDYSRILHVLSGYPKSGRTCDELERSLGMLHQTCSARCSDMKRFGWIYPKGKRPTRSGRDADVLFIARNPNA